MNKANFSFPKPESNTVATKEQRIATTVDGKPERDEWKERRVAMLVRDRRRQHYRHWILQCQIRQIAGRVWALIGWWWLT
jgi:hypothetical protein